MRSGHLATPFIQNLRETIMAKEIIFHYTKIQNVKGIIMQKRIICGSRITQKILLKKFAKRIIGTMMSMI